MSDKKSSYWKPSSKEERNKLVTADDHEGLSWREALLGLPGQEGSLSSTTETMMNQPQINHTPCLLMAPLSRQ